jgi:hypothetical protein
LFDRDWEKAKNLLSKIDINADDGFNNSFKNYIFEYINVKIASLQSQESDSENSFSDDIPFFFFFLNKRIINYAMD